MGRIKPRGRYLAISVPIALHAEIKKHILESSYNSVAEFVKDAVREKMDKEIPGRDFEVFLDYYNKAIVLSGRLEQKDKSFKQITKYLKEMHRILNKIKKVTEVDDDVFELAEKYKPGDMTVSEFIRLLIKTHDEKQKKK